MNAVLKPGQSVPHQYPATPSVTATSPEGVARVKSRRHPWGVWMPGALSSDYQHGQRVIPGHARIVRR